MNDKQYHVAQLVAVCIKKEMTPRSVGFADFIFRLSAAYFKQERRTTRQYIKTLCDAFNYDRWRTLTLENTFLNDEEKRAWISRHS